MHRLSEIDTIIFDLGEVIVDLDVKAVMDEFSRLMEGKDRDFRELIVESSYLFDYEVGRMTDEAFVAEVNRFFGSRIAHDEFKFAWNLMIKGISEKRLDLMQRLKKTHKVLILSNTNAMHESYFDQQVQNLTGKQMKDYAHTAYYSHLIGYRKPNADIYQYIIKEQSLTPEKALFLDDKLENVIAARKVGLLAEQVTYPNQIFEILANE